MLIAMLIKHEANERKSEYSRSLDPKTDAHSESRDSRESPNFRLAPSSN